MSFLSKLQEDNKKNGLFSSQEVSVSYPLGFPLLDQKLGAIYIRRDKDGTVKKDVQLGIPAGSFTIFCGQTSSGKTTAAIQAATNIIEPFGDKGAIVHRDAEKSTTYARVKVLSGWSEEKIKECYTIERENNTWEHLLQEIIEISNQKEEAGEDMKYNTGKYDIWGNEYRIFIPTIIIVDSLMKFVSEHETTDAITGLTANPRSAIYNGVFFRNALEYMSKYNINVFVINHVDDAMPDMRGMQKPKQMTFMPNGKYMSGGSKTKLLTSSIIYFIPVTAKDEISTEEKNGWNGVPTYAYVMKSRTSSGGFQVLMEFIQESGFDSRLTLMRFARENGLIQGRNPKCYFASMPDVKFDTRCFISELARDTSISMALFRECRPLLEQMIPVVDTSNDEDAIRGASAKDATKNALREMYADIGKDS